MIIANGHIYGRNWGFSYNNYPAVTLTTDTYEELKQLILNSSNLDEFDSGMGYEKVMGVNYNDIKEVIEDGEWTKTRSLKPVKLGKLKGRL